MLKILPRRVKNSITLLLCLEKYAPDMHYSPEIQESALEDPVIGHVTKLAGPGHIRLNVGCGTDYREGFINIDGSDALPRVDRVINVVQERLDAILGKEFADYVLANDIVEHVHHWSAVDLLDQFFQVLKPGGGAQIRVPDCEYIIASNRWTIEEKLIMLYGGQEVPRGLDAKTDESRKRYPQFHCHEYGWTMKRMIADLNKVGFRRVAFRREEMNFVAYAVKDESP
ncbi:MAG: class I SAM-dependent methyltransferase [Isosphaeraceae bacterium]